MPTVIKPKRSEVASSIPAANSLAVGEIAMNVTDGKFFTKKSDFLKGSFLKVLLSK